MKHINIILLIALVTLMAACSMLDDPSQSQNPNGNTSGDLAQVRINIGTNARTILPDFDWVFSKYILSAAPTGENTNAAPDPVTISGNDEWGYISVQYGEWIFTVTAYIEVGGKEYAAANGSASLDVSYNSWVNIAVNIPETGGTGTFAYTVAYPAAGSAQVKLEQWPLGGEVLIDNVSVNSGVPGSQSVPSGMYFLTVKATVDDITIPRSEIVHIYPALTSNANYVFTKLDFGDTSLQIGGTIKVLIDGQKPALAHVRVGNEWNNSPQTTVNFTDDDGNGEWSLYLDNLGEADTLNFWVAVNGGLFEKQLSPFPVPADDKPDIDLGTVNFETVLLELNEWKEGYIPADVYVTGDWYRIEVTAGETYYFWMNNRNYGDGTKTAYASMEVLNSNGAYVFGTSNAWYLPRSYTAATSDTVYVRVTAWGNENTTRTYAIAYSTNSNFNNVLDAVAVSLVAETWVEGYVPEGESDTVDWYKIIVTEGETYYFWMNNRYEGDGSHTAWADMQAQYSSGETIFSDVGHAWSVPRSFTAKTSGTVYVRVNASRYDWDDPYDLSSTYAIAYSIDADFHDILDDIAIPLVAETWYEGSVPGGYYTIGWYKIIVTEGETYYFWINNSDYGDGSHTAIAYMDAWYSDGDAAFYGEDNTWDYPTIFYANKGGTIYVRVVAAGVYYYEGNTYAIVYSTDNVRPD
jgi:hypothetical protein